MDAVRLCGPDDHSRARPPHAANEGEVLHYVLPQVLQAHGIWEQRLVVKHAMGWYDRRPRSLDHTFAVGPSDIEAYLQAVIPQEQPAALLIYWWGHHRTGQPRLLCVGLIRTGRRLLLQATEMPADWQLSGLRQALGVTTRQALRQATPRGAQALDPVSPPQRPEALSETAALLLPGPIGLALAAGQARSLLILPVDALGTVPFAALPVGPNGEPLVAYSAVAVAPSIALLKKPQWQTNALELQGKQALVIGDPDLRRDPDYSFAELPGARQEAVQVAQAVTATALLGAQAQHRAVVERLKRGSDLGLVYLATHGITDPANPQDGSFLALSDGHLTTRELKRLPLPSAPLVVLSVCQTGLGKAFEGGIYGMSTAWFFQGARAVVTSLWSVDDAATLALMTQFIRLASSRWAGRALREAANELRATTSDPALWAAFTVVGGLPVAMADAARPPTSADGPIASVQRSIERARALQIAGQGPAALRLLQLARSQAGKLNPGIHVQQVREVQEQIGFWQLQDEFDRYAAFRWPTQTMVHSAEYEKAVQLRARATAVLAERYAAFQTLGASEWTLATALRRGQVWAVAADNFRQLPPPVEIGMRGEDLLDDYDEAMADKAQQARTQAVQIWQAAVDEESQHHPQSLWLAALRQVLLGECRSIPTRS